MRGHGRGGRVKIVPGLIPVLALLASACGDIPQPFRHEGDPAHLARPRTVQAVLIRPLSDDPTLIQIAQSMVKSLESHDLAASLTAGRAGGQVLTLDRDAKDQAVILRWVLYDGAGHQIAAHAQSIGTKAWAKADPANLARITRDAGQSLAPAMTDPEAKPDGQALTLADQRPAIRLSPLPTLPGGGEQSLGAAMQRALDRAGFAVRDDGFAYDLRADIQIRSSGAEDQLSLTWIVLRPDGTELGRIDQGGSVPKGRLSQSWGALARDIAAGGADGVAQVVAADKPRK